MLAYGLFLPISAAGIGLGIGKDIDGVALWPNGMLVLLVHLTLAMLVGGIVLMAMRFKPIKASGIILPIFLGLLSVVDSGRSHRAGDVHPGRYQHPPNRGANTHGH